MLQQACSGERPSTDNDLSNTRQNGSTSEDATETGNVDKLETELIPEQASNIKEGLWHDWDAETAGVRP